MDDGLQQVKEVSLDYEEQNAVRYAAGHITRALTRKIGRSAHPLKQQLILCLNELTENEMDMDADSDHPSREWVNAVDRGGLKHVSNVTYMFFSAMEVSLRKELCKKKTSQLSSLTEIVPVIENDDDTAFYWAMVSANWEMDEDQPTGKWMKGRHCYNQSSSTGLPSEGFHRQDHLWSDTSGVIKKHYRNPKAFVNVYQQINGVKMYCV